MKKLDGLAISKAIEIISYEPQYQSDFEQLNRLWIEEYFGHLEAHDEEMLGDPETYILKPGGHIFLARCNGTIAGACAFVRHSDGQHELAKMVVREDVRARGTGERLARAVIEKAVEAGARQLYLETSTKLAAAMRLYHRLGFRVKDFPHGRSDHYDRADTYMLLKLT